MIAAEDTVLVLLAAGRSRRFGDRDKLDQAFLGQPLGLHAAIALEDVPFMDRVAVVGGSRPEYARHGFRVIVNEDAASGMASSVRIGIAAAKAQGAAAAMVVLADMPRVTAGHVRRLLDAADGADAMVASSDGRDAKPPALFGAGRFDAIMAVTGDRGARDMIRAGRHVVASPAELVDVDTPDELEELMRLHDAPERRP